MVILICFAIFSNGSHLEFSIQLNFTVLKPWSLTDGRTGKPDAYIAPCYATKKENHPKLSKLCSYEILFQGTQEGVRNSPGKCAISV